VKGTAPAQVGIVTARNEDGSIAAGVVVFDVNYRLPSTATITGLHIHDAGPGVNGAITVPLIPNVDPSFTTTSAAGNIFDYTAAVVNTAVLTDILINPENHYANLHTSTDPGGAMRAQLGPIVTASPTVSAAIAANNDKAATTVAPGGLISIYGTNLVKSAATLNGWQGRVLPTSLNGASVTIGGKAAPLLYVSANQIKA
jgi:CHRD domain